MRTVKQLPQANDQSNIMHCLNSHTKKILKEMTMLKIKH